MPYVDGFVIPISRKNLAAYRRVARRANAIWREHGAVECRESVGEDLGPAKVKATFTRLAKLKRGETVLFSWIMFKSRAHRDRVNARVMKDPRIVRMMSDPKGMPFDVKRMTYGGFTTIVDL